MLEPGKYYGRAVEAVLGTTSTGRPQIAVTFELDEPAGQRVVWYGFFTAATEERTIESLRFAGWKGLDFGVFAYGQPLPADMTETVELVVEHETDDRGFTRAKVRWVNRYGGASVKDPMDQARAASFAQQMRAKLAAYDAKQSCGRPAPARRRPPARPAAEPPAHLDDAPGYDDDIEF